MKLVVELPWEDSTLATSVPLFRGLALSTSQRWPSLPECEFHCCAQSLPDCDVCGTHIHTHTHSYTHT